MQPGLAGGRREELSRLEDLFSGLRDSGLRLALIEGPQGVGKGRLIEAFTARARSGGAQILEGIAEPGAPFGPFAAIVERAVAVLARVGATPRLDDLACSDGCHAFWHEHRAAAEPRRAPHARGLDSMGLVQRRCFHEAVRALLRSVGAIHPTIVVMRGLEVADVETLRLVAHLLEAQSLGGRGEGTELMLVGTLRVDHGQPPSTELDALRRHARAVRIHLGALDEAGLRALLSSPEYVARIIARTGGLPSAVERLLAAELPSPEQHLARRLGDLSAPARALFEGLAVLGRPSSVHALAAVTDVEHVARALPELLASGLVVLVAGDAQRVAPNDPADCERTLASLGDERRTDLHQRCMAHHLSPQGEGPAVALPHALALGDHEQCLALAHRAADALASIHAHADAAALLVRVAAAVHDVPPSLDARLADALEASGELRKALKPARRALAAEPSSLAAARRLARLYVLAGDLSQAADVIERARAAAAAAGDGVAAIGLSASLAELSYQAGRLDAADAHARETLASEEHSPEAVLDARQTRAKVALATGRVQDAVALYLEYERAARDRGDVRHEALAAGGRGVAWITAGDYEEAERALRQGARLAERACDLKGQALAWHNLAVVAHLRHDYGTARTRYEEALRLLQLVGNRPSLARVAYNLGELYETLGDLGRARSVCELGAHLGGADVPPRAQAEGLLLRGRVELGERRAAAARAAFEAADGILSQVDPIRGVACKVGLARVALLEGRVDDAAALVARDFTDVDRVRAADVAIVRAEIASAEARPDDVGAWHDAVENAARSGDESHELRALVGYAEACLRQGRDATLARRRAAELDATLARRVPEDLAARWDDRPIRRRLLALHEGRARPAPTRATNTPAQRLGMVGESRAVRRVLGLVDRVGPSDCNVLIRGESGTGKELVARALHATSSRREGPMVCVNCAAIVDTLLLSELFGHERGAFTGAHERKLGRFEVANGGTLFLDEIGDISPAVQAALLRVLQERRFERVGGHETIEVDVRVVAATNRDLNAMVREGSFREDLFYRLEQVSVAMPPLRERPEDVPALAAYFLSNVATERGEPARRLSRDALAVLMAHRWPGNVRQLDNVLRAATLFADGPVIRPVDLSLEGHATPDASSDTRAIEDAVAKAAWVAAPGSEADLCYSRLRGGELSLRDLKKEIERECIERALAECGGNISRAAELLGMKRPRLSQLVKEYGLRQPDGGDET